MSSDDLFNEPDYADNQSATLQMSDDDFEHYRINGWPIETHGTHWISRKQAG